MADKPWLFRTYAGHSTAKASNTLFRSNLGKGQTGLSVAFDLPTQTGYDSDHELARGEVGKVGVPICHLGDMRQLFENIPLAQMNTSMTINATAPWLLALYIAAAQEQGAEVSKLKGTVQNDILKEYLSRGTYIFPPEPSLRLTCDVASYCLENLPMWNPMNVCSYHLQEAGATPVQEMAFAFANAFAVLDRMRDIVSPEEFPGMVARVSFFVNAGIRFITEICKMRAFTELWDEFCLDRYGITDPKQRRFRYGVQVNSLGLTEQQPENNNARILIEMLAVTLSRNARARAVQLPAWNEALGLPRPWDQQWSLRMQQILAFETDLLEFEDIFDGNPAIEKKVSELKEATKDELSQIEAMGGSSSAIEYMKSQLVLSNARRLSKIETGESTIVGVNKFQETETGPLSANNGDVLVVDPLLETQQINRLRQWKAIRDPAKVNEALAAVRNAVVTGENVMPASIEAAKVGVTTGEWADIMRDAFGEYRGPTGVRTVPSNAVEGLDEIRETVMQAAQKLGTPIRLLVGKPGLDGHSNGAEQIACRARDCGMEVVYDGIRLTPDELIATALEIDAHVIGLSILSGSHLHLVTEFMSKLSAAGGEIPVIVGGIISQEDITRLEKMGVRKIYTPKDFEINTIMRDIALLSLTP